MDSNLRPTRTSSICLLSSRHLLICLHKVSTIISSLSNFGEAGTSTDWSIPFTGRSIFQPVVASGTHITSTDTYTTIEDYRSQNANPGAWRGSYTVGIVAAHRLDQFEREFARIPIMRNDPGWDFQNWVLDALRSPPCPTQIDINWKIYLWMLQAQITPWWRIWNTDQENTRESIEGIKRDSLIARTSPCDASKSCSRTPINSTSYLKLDKRKY
ncbi:uncharacterized protein EDB91DRAFT_603968 [Suillus paluster]|uniref:uncharacterized protein n=1 Tax=Suillus paluster TaxID=48578 RepID=UPI001B860471|nr:uncharacterized protein EDB91DRAFT_603968 [Suillus paluster]KAG1751381.1 hypothetical protein EDB91DRAFT_603968 [Suillus paluster]